MRFFHLHTFQKKMNLKQQLNPDKCIILSVAIGGWYPKGLDRLAESLKTHCVNFKFWRNEYPPGSPTHQKHPYAFKYFAMKWARDQGYTHILWVDVSFWFLKHPIELFKLIDNNKFFITTNGCLLNEYTNQNCWALLKENKNDYKGVLTYSAGLTGLNLTDQKASEFLDKMLVHAVDGSFVGAWTGPDRHRHDQSVGTILLNQMKIRTDEDYFKLVHFADCSKGETTWGTVEFQKNFPEAVIVIRGM